ncbi:hypothetical protein [Hoyosella altamirensis]|uniref:Uncharacterized protein n=1 Tax=Hoyosella altamirensis TaxID=616997 RepID=A0A839RKU2_9ACTN|nr:hypothetical protein [Hoyosella altamirensis]MBB3037305.1 hypothetical protein [Hoyosella altamirensis]
MTELGGGARISSAGEPDKSDQIKKYVAEHRRRGSIWEVQILTSGASGIQQISDTVISCDLDLAMDQLCTRVSGREQFGEGMFVIAAPFAVESATFNSTPSGKPQKVLVSRLKSLAEERRLAWDGWRFLSHDEPLSRGWRDAEG